jgi:hypothetical protein
MNTELLTCRRFTAGLVYQPFPMQQVQVNRIYADLTERFPYANLQHLPDGARMSNPDGDFFIQTTRMQVNDNSNYFGSNKEKAMELFRMAQARLNVPQFLTFGIKLTAFLPMSKGINASELLDNAIFGPAKADLKLLGDGRRGTGLRFVIHRDGIYEVKIEPFFSDTSQMYIELDVQHPTPFNDISIVEPKMQSAYDYLFGEIQDYLKTLG